jgi:hypothetical protein
MPEKMPERMPDRMSECQIECQLVGVTRRERICLKAFGSCMGTTRCPRLDQCTGGHSPKSLARSSKSPQHHGHGDATPNPQQWIRVPLLSNLQKQQSFRPLGGAYGAKFLLLHLGPTIATPNACIYSNIYNRRYSAIDMIT